MLKCYFCRLPVRADVDNCRDDSFYQSLELPLANRWRWSCGSYIRARALPPLHWPSERPSERTRVALRKSQRKDYAIEVIFSFSERRECEA
ncbi:hypothetical protein EVAR_82779_1 [Eumeta japonica]|uniref:Uncharacterized protein n=1 Tax=Eumeta variegata TaxID=151549 RepID=A0A4C1UNH5_EUMVA|nr:hypothetical protein EVAR_82779_1 [Eumeta japonica]